MPEESVQIKEHFLTNSFGDTYLYGLNHNTLNRTGAAQQHRARLGHLVEEKDTLFIIIGSDSGTLFSFLSANQAGSGTRFLVVEPDPVYPVIAEHVQELQLPETVDFIAAKDFREAADRIRINRYLYAGSVRIVKSLAAEYDFLGSYRELFFTIQTLCNQQEYLVRQRLQNQTFKQAQLKNIAENHTPSLCLKDIFQGKTAVLLAGGPSLDDILPWVQEHRDSLVVLAVSRICRRLLDVELTPDIIFSIDPHQVSFDVSKEALNFWKDSLLVHSYHVSPLLLAQWRGKSIYLGNRFPWKSTLNCESLTMAGPTVSNTALSVAVEMGVERIILAGVDLCHSRDGYTHASGSNEHAAGPQLAQTTTQVETNGGWMAETTSDFLAAIDILAMQVQEAVRHNTTVINPSANSARIKGVEHVPLKKIHLEPMTPPASEILAPVGQLPKKEQRIHDLEQVQDELRWITGQLTQVTKLCREALACNEGLFGRKGKKQDFKYKKRMDKIERKLNSTYGKSTVFVKEYGAYDLLQMTILSDEDEWTEQEIEEAAATYYTKYGETASTLLKLIDETRQRIQSRMDEESDHPDFRELFSRWRNEKTPGRLHVWLHHHNKNIEDLPPERVPEARQLAEAFALQLDTSADSAHMQRSRTFAKLNELRGKILMYFQKKDVQALENLQHSLARHESPDAEKYLYLCKGLFHELAEEWDDAIEAYQHLFEAQDEILLEDALLRITSISLQRNDMENSFLALENLSHLSPVYLHQCGDLLRLTGNHEQALDTYLSYIERVPGDIETMLKIGQYYRELGIEQGARTIFEHILSLDPDNRAARQLLEEKR